MHQPKLEYFPTEGGDSEMSSPSSGSLMGPSPSDGYYSVMEVQGLMHSGEYLCPKDERPATAQSFSEASNSSGQGAPPFDASLPAEVPVGDDDGRPQRSPKKTTAEEQKDDKYVERRRRNNAAAKKSRDARRQRVLSKVARQDFLESENSRLHREVVELRNQVKNMKTILDNRGNPDPAAAAASAAAAAALNGQGIVVLPPVLGAVADGHGVGLLPPVVGAAADGHGIGLLPPVVSAAADGHGIGLLPPVVSAATNGHVVGLLPPVVSAATNGHGVALLPPVVGAAADGHGIGLLPPLAAVDPLMLPMTERQDSGEGH